MINGIVNGIKSCIGNAINAVSDVANAIRSYLHFSVPDVGSLTDYESWMPDFMGGLWNILIGEKADGIYPAHGITFRRGDLKKHIYKGKQSAISCLEP